MFDHSDFGILLFLVIIVVFILLILFWRLHFDEDAVVAHNIIKTLVKW